MRPTKGRVFASAGVAGLLAGGALLAAGVVASASVAPMEEGFENFPGNATTCDDAGLAGELLAGTDQQHEDITASISGDDNQYLNIVVHDDDLVISGTVVKGGPAYRVYYGDPVENMTAPPLEKRSSDGEAPATKEKYPAVSHWFICGERPEPTKTPEPTQEPTKTPEPTQEPTKTPKPTEEPTKTPEPSQSPTPTEEPTKTPEPSQSPTPTEEPTKTPEPTEEPEPTQEPTAEPTQEPTDEPDMPDDDDDDEGDLPDTGSGAASWLIVGGSVLALGGAATLAVTRRRGHSTL